MKYLTPDPLYFFWWYLEKGCKRKEQFLLFDPFQALAWIEISHILDMFPVTIYYKYHAQTREKSNI